MASLEALTSHTNKKRAFMSRLAISFATYSRQPKNVFKIIGILACIAIYVAQIQHSSGDRMSNHDLTIGSQGIVNQLLGRLFDESVSYQSPYVMAVIFGVFVACLFFITGRRRPGKLTGALVVLQILIGLLVTNDLLLIVAAQLPFVYALPKALLWMVGQSAGMFLLWGYIFASAYVLPYSWLEPAPFILPEESRLEMGLAIASSLLMFLVWQIFAFCLGYIGVSERTHRDHLTAVNAQLLATQQLLAENARNGERIRIARELHDSLGHHLTALGLHLEIASRQTSDMGIASLQTAKGIARDLLSDVRIAVGRERKELALNLEQSLRTMCAGIPTLQVTFDYSSKYEFSDPVMAHTIFRSIQEAISNTMRHANATKLSVMLRTEENRLKVEIKDNGIGAKDLNAGNGLKGMRERIEACAGRLEIYSEFNKGFTVIFWLLLEGSNE
ncbi:sensor histidine kinase [Alkalimonas amylolytica]|uniref:Signal transduction histidine kinase n=1 Tax=Alkalimonas amylolytica TaxID=152573 RepID=A0A1H4D0U4_ALKAM|nr:sensor histidine kinase [Alkalimonas amylolytica]SEA66069.1 Signal transduction histidine kinase [Alkalimonas amylolytica]